MEDHAPGQEPLSLSIVIPAYNEERGLPHSLATLTTYLAATGWTWDIRVVDDGSTDRTRQVVEAFSRTDPRVILQAEPHRGKGGAVRAGMLASRAPYRFLCDADLSMPVHELPRFLPPQRPDVDIAIGSREGFGARRVGEPVARHIAGRAFNAVVSALLPGISDTQCGFKMFTGAAADAVFPHVTVTGWAFDIEALYIARMRGLTIREIPIEWHYRPESRVRMVRDGIGMIREVMRIRRRARRHLYADDTAVGRA